MQRLIFFISIICFSMLATKSFSQAEMTRQEFDSIKRAVIQLDLQVNQINQNLIGAKRTLKTGVFIATLGYTVTIIGGQLLGVNPDLGEALLYAGGAIGIGGTIILVRGFNKISLGLSKKRNYAPQ